MIKLVSRLTQRWRGNDVPVEPAGISADRAAKDPCDGPSYALLKRERIARQHDREVDIVICAHNALDYLKPCLASVLNTLGPRHRVIVVDDASNQQVRDHLGTLSGRNDRVYVHHNTARTGYTKAANTGLRLSGADFVILLNSDTVVAPNWIEKLCDAVYTTEGAGIVGPLSSAASFQSIPDHRSTTFQTAINRLPPNMSAADVDLLCESWTNGTILPRVPLIHGFCFGLRRAVIDAIGLFDELRFPDGYGEEDDYCLRATDAGFGLVIATHTYVFHAKTKSYSLSERQTLAAAADRALRARHGNERVDSAIQTLASNAILNRFRCEAAILYECN